MPRASDYLLPGYTYHLTHRCIDQQFLLRFARDRDCYRDWLREGVNRHRVPVYGYCITSNHVHVIAHADSVEAVSQLMHLAAGATAKQYNLRKSRTGAVWEHPYQCTVVEDGRHLLNCLVYVSLNMVRASVVAHPREWGWCSHDELVGDRQRYRLIDKDRLLQSIGTSSEQGLREWYLAAVERRITERALLREGHWTESLAVGSRNFIERTTREYAKRWSFVTTPVPDSDGTAWAVRDLPGSYTVFSAPKRACNDRK
jgi:putative transposase